MADHKAREWEMLRYEKEWEITPEEQWPMFQSSQYVITF